jgi:hypothetical protein
MRIQLLVLAVLAAACRPASPPAEPLPSPAPPAPQFPNLIEGVIIESGTRICVLRNGHLEYVDVEYAPQSGDTTYQGRPFSAAFPTDRTYALNAAWYRDNMPIALAGTRYIKYGLPRILWMTDVVPILAFQGVTVFAEPTADARRPEVVYVPVRPGCEFQPYQRGGIK